MENGIVVPQKVKNRATIEPNDSTSGYLPEENENVTGRRKNALTRSREDTETSVHQWTKG